MIASIVGLAFAAQISVLPPPAPTDTRPLEQVQYGVPRHPPPCGTGWDQSARDGLCYPSGYLPPQEQAARQRYYGGPGPMGGPMYRGGRYPVPCGDGADLDIRDGQCYPNGTVPRRYQDRPQYHNY